MKEMLTVKVKGRYIVVPKLIGAFFILISALMLVYASLDAVTTWDRIRDLRSCVSGIYSAEDPADAYSVCVLKGIAAGVYVYTPNFMDGGARSVPDEEFWTVMMPKLAQWLFWVVVLIVAILVYQWGKLVIPVQEEVAELTGIPAEAKESENGGNNKENTTKRRRSKKSKK
ncbi:MAG TPA: hypothetical protein EYH23_00965 [Euryarchaeota archaeon]|nr:hypothetical protein [Euryarchaeota archaeon]HIQ10071.1 hypothetical protein [Euryarchaeota archaeon]